MTIIEMKPVNMAEAIEYVAEDTEIKGFIKKFAKLNEKDALKMQEKLEKLDNIKIKPEHIVKIVDLLPEDVADINKIFNDVNMDENETKNILEIVKEFK